MRGTMMDFPLTLKTILERAGKQFSKVELVSRRPDRSVVRTNYRVFSERARRLASALNRLGLRTMTGISKRSSACRARAGFCTR